MFLTFPTAFGPLVDTSSFAAFIRAAAANVRDPGAETVIDFRAERFKDKASDVDAVIVLVGEVPERSFNVLKSGGKLGSAVSKPDQAFPRGAHFFLVGVTERLERIAWVISAGELRTMCVTVIPLAAVHQVQEILNGKCPRPKRKFVLQR